MWEFPLGQVHGASSHGYLTGCQGPVSREVNAASKQKGFCGRLTAVSRRPKTEVLACTAALQGSSGMSDSEEEEVFFGCVVCSGANGRARRSPGSATCKHDNCKNVYKKRRADGATLATAQPAAAPVETTRCFKIKEVLGVSMRLDLTADERRVGAPADDEQIGYKVRGGFGKSADEDVGDLIPDTRWIKLSELVHMDETQLKALDTFAAGLKKACQAARKRLREQEE